jgi:UDP-4-amino-4,6-dideoxy-N-acetyl-beta-L-altrosamine transaminase
MESDFLTQGPVIEEFEKAFAHYIGSRYAVAVSNGTAALHLSAKALGVQKGDRYITSPITFLASANCVEYNGGEIDLVDINRDSYTIDLEKVERKLKNSKPGTFKGIIPVDMAGYPVDLERLQSLAEKYDLRVLEDSCHAPGGYFTNSQGERVNCGSGRYSDLAIFSFHPVKHIATGEGGMITTNDKNLYEELIILRNHGITKDPVKMANNDGPWYYEMQTLGYNYRLTDMASALGLAQLKRAAANLEKRRSIARRYDQAFSGTVLKLPMVDQQFHHAYHLYIIRHKKRAELFDHLKHSRIDPQVHYIPIYKQPYYSKYGWNQETYPEAEAYYNECLSLPMYPGLLEEQQQYVIETVLEFLGKKE